MIRVPVLLDFDYEQVVGHLEIDESYLPTLPNFVFSIGYLITPDLTEYRLKCVSILNDAKYTEYLKDRNSNERYLEYSKGEASE